MVESEEAWYALDRKYVSDGKISNYFRDWI